MISICPKYRGVIRITFIISLHETIRSEKQERRLRGFAPPRPFRGLLQSGRFEKFFAPGRRAVVVLERQTPAHQPSDQAARGIVGQSVRPPRRRTAPLVQPQFHERQPAEKRLPRSGRPSLRETEIRSQPGRPLQPRKSRRPVRQRRPLPQKRPVRTRRPTAARRQPLQQG